MVLDFSALGLNDILVRASHAYGFLSPTPIQSGAIPPALAGKDILGAAHTGTGKTAAYLLPIFQRCMQAQAQHMTPRGVFALVVAPTRELATQIEQVACALRGDAEIELALVIGGTAMEAQVRKLRTRPHILIATPGRLIEHVLAENIDLGEVRIAVLDEADRLLELGFYTDTRRLLRAIHARPQIMLFSATLSREVQAWARELLNDPATVEADTPGSLVMTLSESVCRVKPSAKPWLLSHVLRAQACASALVFVRTRARVEALAAHLRSQGIAATGIHGRMSHEERHTVLADFMREGKAHGVLVATDLAARGLDVSELETVINVDMPEDPADYVHRVGRTARMGQTGRVLNLVADDEVPRLRNIEALTGRTITEMTIEGFEDSAGKRFPAIGKAHPKGTVSKRNKPKAARIFAAKVAKPSRQASFKTHRRKSKR